MKNRYFRALYLIALVGFVLLQQACLGDKCEGTRTFIQYTPIYKSIEDIRLEVGVEQPRELCNPGKMFLYGDYIYVNDIRKGIHIIDNSNPASPVPIAFINIPGNVDIAVKDKILYADNYTDLEFFDISLPATPEYKGRVEDVFFSATLNSVLGQLVGYNEEEVTAEYDCDNNRYYVDDHIFEGDFSLPNILVGDFVNSTSGAPSIPSGVQGVQGVAGSLSRFANHGDHLYVIDNERGLDVFDITDRCNPIHKSEIFIDRGIETLFPSGANLFIGADDGLYIYGLGDPLTPNFISKFEHARSCDPVFVQEQTAYVTLRSGNACQGFVNQLDVLDVQDIFSPSLITSVSMDNPHGLSVKDDLLIVCEGSFGFKIFDKSDADNILNNELSHIDSFSAFDVIILPGTSIALVIGEEGLYQYDISQAADPNRLSLISASRNCNF